MLDNVIGTQNFSRPGRSFHDAIYNAYRDSEPRVATFTTTATANKSVDKIEGREEAGEDSPAPCRELSHDSTLLPRLAASWPYHPSLIHFVVPTRG
jgi:hypothetical protein